MKIFGFKPKTKIRNLASRAPRLVLISLISIVAGGGMALFNQFQTDRQPTPTTIQKPMISSFQISFKPFTDFINEIKHLFALPPFPTQTASVVQPARGLASRADSNFPNTNSPSPQNQVSPSARNSVLTSPSQFVSRADFNSAISNLRNDFGKSVSALLGSLNQSPSNQSLQDIYRMIADTQRINQLSSVSISSPVITGTPSIVNYVSTSGGSVTGDFSAGGNITISGTGTSTIENNLQVKGNLKVGLNSLTISDTSMTAAGGSFTIGTENSDDNLSLQTYGRVGISSTSPWGVLSVEHNGANASMPIFVASEQGVASPYFLVDHEGRVGIGTSSPTDTLSVNGPIYLANVSPSQTTNRLYSNTNSLYWSGNLIGGASTGVWSSDGTNVYRTTGNVGLGTTSPYAKLSIEGSSALGNSALAGYFTATSTTATSTFSGNVSVGGNLNFNGTFLQNNTPFVGSQWTTSGSNIYYNTGSVGIGTSLLSDAKFKVTLDSLSVSDTYDNQNKIASIGNNTVSGGKLRIVEATCGSYSVLGANGLTYGTVLADDGHCWLDRNLGATRVAISKNDYGPTEGGGYYYQWGRLTDGHQIWNSGTTETQSSGDVPGHSNFIKGSGDWRNPGATFPPSTLWQGLNGVNNPCPTGFRLPTQPEWADLATAEGITNGTSDDKAFASTLKLPLAGYRNNNNAVLGNQGANGSYWSSTSGGADAYDLSFNSSSVDPAYYNNRALGFSVRCLKDY